MYNPDIFTVSLNIKSKAYHNKKYHHISESQKAFYIARFLLEYFHLKRLIWPKPKSLFLLLFDI